MDVLAAGACLEFKFASVGISTGSSLPNIELKAPGSS